MAYAYLDGKHAVEVHPGRPFITHEIVVTDDGAFYADQPPEPKKGEEPEPVKPLKRGTVVQVQTRHPANALELYGPEDLARYRIQIVEEPEAPDGEVMVSRQFVADKDGQISIKAKFEAAPLPESLPLLNIKLALMGIEKLEAVEEAVVTAEPVIRVYWQSAATVKPADDLFQFIAKAAGLKADDLFAAAATVEA